jgi:hypothetical protein
LVRDVVPAKLWREFDLPWDTVYITAKGYRQELFDPGIRQIGRHTFINQKTKCVVNEPFI